MSRLRKCLAAVFFLCVAVSKGEAASLTQLGELTDPALEARAKDLCLIIKCPTCQGQCISDSNADMAQDLRLFVRTRLNEGACDQEILDALVAHFGPSVLFAPPLSPHTLFLWSAPLLFLGAGLFLALRRPLRTRPKRL